MTINEEVGIPVVVPDGVEYVEPEVRALAAGIAADIRERGHWQDPHGCPEGVCVVTAPSYNRALNDPQQHYERLQQIILGHDPEWHVGPGSVPYWNDTTPTAAVLARLDAIAEGLVAA